MMFKSRNSVKLLTLALTCFASTAMANTATLAQPSEAEHSIVHEALQSVRLTHHAGHWHKLKELLQRCAPQSHPMTAAVCGKDIPIAVDVTWDQCATPHGTSSGTVNIKNTLASDANAHCDTGIAMNMTASVAFSATGRGGGTMSVKATDTSETASGIESLTLDNNQSLTFPGGRTVGTHFTGTLKITHSAEHTRTVVGTLQAEHANGTRDSVHIANVIQSQHSVCSLPTGGSITITPSQGSPHTLVFSSVCGNATFDGKMIMLPEHNGPHNAGHGAENPPSEQP